MPIVPVPSVSVDLTALLPYLEEKFKSWIGLDEESQAHAEWFKTLQASSLQLASVVRCVGMSEAIPFEDLYQPTRLVRRSLGVRRGEYSQLSRTERSFVLAEANRFREITIADLLKSREDASIFAGPGWGKTTFLHFLFRALLKTPDVLPVLITLRRTNALNDLEKVVQLGTDLNKQQQRDQLVLLVDGYDEVDPASRRRVSDALLKFQGLGLGRFYLTCRDFYEVSLITAPEVRILGFTQKDKYGFVSSFLKAFDSKLDPVKTVDDLQQRGFDDFLSHPLLLALACIVETTSHTNHPRSALRLLQRALDVLAYRWDDQKIIERHALTILDGRDRIELLKRIAFASGSPYMEDLRVRTLARQELSLMHFDRVDENRVLLETAQFYGILVPKDGGWEFVHRSLQDFLAAQYWVETGQFATEKKFSWNSRTAYGACLSRDATSIILQALDDDEARATLAEIFTNSPSFDLAAVSEKLIEYFAMPDRNEIYESDLGHYISGRLCSDFIRLADTRFLNRLAEYSSEDRTPLGDLLVAYCAIEIAHRRIRFDRVTYTTLLDRYRNEEFLFQVIEVDEVKLLQVRPLGF